MTRCRDCGSELDVREGLCASCRTLHPEEASHAQDDCEPDLPDPKAPHDQPWVPRSGLTDRIRRNPRK